MAWYKHQPTNLGWFWRGTQSAIFYYVACTPCVMYSAKRKQQRENKRAMAERIEQMRLAEGMFYGQPLPFQTNEAWRSEIDLGADQPSPASVTHVVPAIHSLTSSPSRPSMNGHEDQHRPPKPRHDLGGKGARGQSKHEDTTSNPPKLSKNKTEGRDLQPITPDRKPSVRKGKGENSSSVEQRGTPNTVASRRQQSSRGSGAEEYGSNASTTVVSVSTEHGGGDVGSVGSEDGTCSRKRRYQRPVEPLWGITDGFGPVDKLNDCADPEPVPAWYVQRNPEVNELHPPVVSSLPKCKKDALWMLQPPPPAAFMEGRTDERQVATHNRRHAGRSAAAHSTNRPRVASKNRRPSPSESGSSQDNKETKPRRKRRPKPLGTISSNGI